MKANNALENRSPINVVAWGAAMACILTTGLCGAQSPSQSQTSSSVAQSARTDYGGRSRPPDMSEPREVSDAELIEKRGEPEDRLRKELLSNVKDEDKIEELKKVLNRPWDVEGVEYVARLNAFDILACLSSRYKANAEVASTARNCMNKAIHDRCLAMSTNGLIWRTFPPIIQALRIYGDEEMVLIPAIWEMMSFETPDTRFLDVIIPYGDQRALARLKKLRDSRTLEMRIEECQGLKIDMAILVIEEKLKHPEVKILGESYDSEGERFSTAESLWLDDQRAAHLPIQGPRYWRYGKAPLAPAVEAILKETPSPAPPFAVTNAP